MYSIVLLISIYREREKKEYIYIYIYVTQSAVDDDCAKGADAEGLVWRRI